MRGSCSVSTQEGKFGCLNSYLGSQKSRKVGSIIAKEEGTKRVAVDITPSKVVHLEPLWSNKTPSEKEDGKGAKETERRKGLER
ncbi:hypothetical protein VTK73DRAFT_4232 [Phialemonium thermophilum]|uniref:Uncharacterized protein n=1 Tax=Phialemonium thermophilum TaxID=223376 RepID=A0ABR3VB90_9PEZI